MSWTVPPTFSTSQLVTATIMQVLSDDLSYLLNRPKGSTFRNNVGNYTTTSTSFANIDTTNLSHTLTVTGTSVIVGFSGAGYNSASGNESDVYFDISVDGTRVGGTSGVVAQFLKGTVSQPENFSFTVLVTGLSAGSHTFKIMWRVSNAAITANLLANSANTTPNFWAVEVG